MSTKRYVGLFVAGAIVAGCALTIQYDEYERASETSGVDGGGSGSTSGIGGGGSGGTFGGGSGGTAGSTTGGGGAPSGGGVAGAGVGGNCSEGTTCKPPECSGMQYTTFTCQLNECKGFTEICNPYNCDLNQGCLKSCTGSNQCESGFKCSGGLCEDCVLCSEKYADPNTAKPFCETDSALKWNQVVGCCQAGCSLQCKDSLGQDMIVCGGSSPEIINPDCDSCLQSGNCTLNWGLCQSDQPE